MIGSFGLCPCLISPVSTAVYSFEKYTSNLYRARRHAKGAGAHRISQSDFRY